MTPDRLRIAFVVHDYHRHSGHSRYVVELATRFRHDHDVHVFTNVVEDTDTAGITFHHVPAWRPNVLATILSFIVPATLQARGRFDVVHSQGLCGLRHNVATAHICQPAWYDAIDREHVRPTWRQRVSRSVLTRLERRAFADPPVRRVIAVSGRVRDDLARYYRRTTGVEVIYHGVDSATFHPDNRARLRSSVRAAVGLPDHRFVALYVGDLKKGATAAIEAVARTPGVTLLVVTASDTRPWQAEAAAAGAADRVIFHPHAKQVEGFYAAADVYLFPTLYDSYGLVIAEAMATGLPVITTRAAGVSEVITHGTDGFLTEAGWDVPALAEHLARLRDDPGLRERIGAAARKTIEPYTWDHTAAETLAVYRDTIGGQP
jgi:UDP-glucose:(heptosyl)LPS alpha-1,3-glucosyltransferase